MYSDRADIAKELFGNIEDIKGSCLNGSDYDHGAVEDAQATASNSARALVMLVRALTDKKVLTPKEAVDVLYEYPTAKWDEFDPKV